ncbi:MAG: arylesterase, partial [Hydrocarboniphaga effusa]|nr:arylesterase [Hydrocarboniphaga effusa]
PPKQLRGNLVQMAALARKAGAQPILFQMRIPSNYGPAYADGFFESFRRVARQYQAPLVPFFLASLLDQPGMFQDDGIHPTVEAQARLLDAAWPTLDALLRESKPARAANIITTP